MDKAINGTLSVPTLAMCTGDFSSTGVTIYDNATGTATGTGKTAFGANMIPTARIAPAAAILLKNLPVPNSGAAGALANNYFDSATNAFERENYQGKVTYIPNQNTSFFGHYSISPETIS